MKRKRESSASSGATKNRGPVKRRKNEQTKKSSAPVKRRKNDEKGKSSAQKSKRRKTAGKRKASKGGGSRGGSRPSRSSKKGKWAARKSRDTSSEDESSSSDSSRSSAPDADARRLFSMGSDVGGELGLGPDPEPPEVDTPTEVSLAALRHNTYVEQIATGGNSTLCVSNTGRLYGCGELNKTQEFSIPTEIDLSFRVRHVSSGDCHIALVTDQGRLYLSGTFRNSVDVKNNPGEIGLLKKSNGQIIQYSKIFVEIPHVERFTDVCSGLDHVVCLTEQGRVYSLGCGARGRLGRIPAGFFKHYDSLGTHLWLSFKQVIFPATCSEGNGRASRTTVRATVETTIARIWATPRSTFAKTNATSNGEEVIFAWGANNSYELGMGDMEDRPFPQPARMFERALARRKEDLGSDNISWIEIAGGNSHTLALDSTGIVHSMGFNTALQLGDGPLRNSDHRKTLKPIRNLQSVNCASVCAFDDSCLAVTRAGKLYAWGSNDTCQLGLPDESVQVPTLVKGDLKGRNVLAVSLNTQHAVVLTGRKNS